MKRSWRSRLRRGEPETEQQPVDVLAVLERFGIRGFVYHTWSSTAQYMARHQPPSAAAKASTATEAAAAVTTEEPVSHRSEEGSTSETGAYGAESPWERKGYLQGYGTLERSDSGEGESQRISLHEGASARSPRQPPSPRPSDIGPGDSAFLPPPLPRLFPPELTGEDDRSSAVLAASVRTAAAVDGYGRDRSRRSAAAAEAPPASPIVTARPARTQAFEVPSAAPVSPTISSRPVRIFGSRTLRGTDSGLPTFDSLLRNVLDDRDDESAALPAAVTAEAPVPVDDSSLTPVDEALETSLESQASSTARPDLRESETPWVAEPERRNPTGRPPAASLEHTFPADAPRFEEPLRRAPEPPVIVAVPVVQRPAARTFPSHAAPVAMPAGPVGEPRTASNASSPEPAEDMMTSHTPRATPRSTSQSVSVRVDRIPTGEVPRPIEPSGERMAAEAPAARDASTSTASKRVIGEPPAPAIHVRTQHTVGIPWEEPEDLSDAPIPILARMPDMSALVGTLTRTPTTVEAGSVEDWDAAVRGERRQGNGERSPRLISKIDALLQNAAATLASREKTSMEPLRGAGHRPEEAQPEAPPVRTARPQPAAAQAAEEPVSPPVRPPVRESRPAPSRARPAPAATRPAPPAEPPAAGRSARVAEPWGREAVLPAAPAATSRSHRAFVATWESDLIASNTPSGSTSGSTWTQGVEQDDPTAPESGEAARARAREAGPDLPVFRNKRGAAIEERASGRAGGPPREFPPDAPTVSRTPRRATPTETRIPLPASRESRSATPSGETPLPATPREAPGRTTSRETPVLPTREARAAASRETPALPARGSRATASSRETTAPPARESRAAASTRETSPSRDTHAVPTREASSAREPRAPVTTRETRPARESRTAATTGEAPPARESRAATPNREAPPARDARAAVPARETTTGRDSRATTSRETPVPQPRPSRAAASTRETPVPRDNHAATVARDTREVAAPSAPEPRYSPPARESRAAAPARPTYGAAVASRETHAPAPSVVPPSRPGRYAAPPPPPPESFEEEEESFEPAAEEAVPPPGSARDQLRQLLLKGGKR